MDKARQLSLWDPHLTRASATVCLGQGPPAPTTEEPNSEDATSHQRCAILLISKERPSSAGFPLPGLTMGPPYGRHHLLLRCGLHAFLLSEGSLNNLRSAPGGLPPGFHPDTLSMTEHHGKPCDDNGTTPAMAERTAFVNKAVGGRSGPGDTCAPARDTTGLSGSFPVNAATPTPQILQGQLEMLREPERR